MELRDVAQHTRRRGRPVPLSRQFVVSDAHLPAWVVQGRGGRERERGAAGFLSSSAFFVIETAVLGPGDITLIYEYYYHGWAFVIVIRTHDGLHKTYISLSLLTVFGSDYYVPSKKRKTIVECRISSSLIPLELHTHFGDKST